MSTANIKSPAELFDDFIKLEWQDIFRKEVDVFLPNGSRYVPNSGSQGVSLLRKNVNAFDEAIRLWSGPTDEPENSTEGYDRIVDQAGIQYTWEWFLIDESRPWSSAVPALVRERIEADLARRDKNALVRAKAAAAEAHRLAEEEDSRTIALMNAKRADEGKPPLTQEQTAVVLEGRRERRAEKA
ncbi:MAG: hypothetical protein JO156_08720 [Solirubrobacterales bacterium]|nr:hypothetical protein [Solirubrobacterales bacterium]